MVRTMVPRKFIEDGKILDSKKNVQILSYHHLRPAVNRQPGYRRVVSQSGYKSPQTPKNEMDHKNKRTANKKKLKPNTIANNMTDTNKPTKHHPRTRLARKRSITW